MGNGASTEIMRAVKWWSPKDCTLLSTRAVRLLSSGCRKPRAGSMEEEEENLNMDGLIMG